MSAVAGTDEKGPNFSWEHIYAQKPATVEAEIAALQGKKKVLSSLGSNDLKALGVELDAALQLRDTAQKTAVQVNKLLKLMSAHTDCEASEAITVRRGALQGQLKTHDQEVLELQERIANGTYEYLNAKKQVSNYEYYTWKMTSYETIFKRYVDYRKSEQAYAKSGTAPA